MQGSKLGGSRALTWLHCWNFVIGGTYDATMQRCALASDPAANAGRCGLSFTSLGSRVRKGFAGLLFQLALHTITACLRTELLGRPTGRVVVEHGCSAPSTPVPSSAGGRAESLGGETWRRLQELDLFPVC